MTHEESNVANDRDDQTGIANESTCKICDHHTAISMYILHTVFYTFHKVLTGRIYLTIKNFFILVTLKHDSGVMLEIRCYEVLLGDQRINF